MNKDLTFVLSSNVKYFLLTLFLLHFISFTECFIATNGYSINGSYSLNPTSSRYRNINQYQQCFSSNNTDVSIDTDVSNNSFITTTQPIIDDILQDKTKSDHLINDHEHKFFLIPKRYKTYHYMINKNFIYVHAIIRAELKSLVEIIKTEIEKMRSYGMHNTWRYKVLDTRCSKIKVKDVSAIQQPGIAVLYKFPISNTLQKKLSEKDIKVIKGEKIDDIIEMAREELSRIAGEKRVGKLCGKGKILKVIKTPDNTYLGGCVVTYGRINPYMDVRIMREDKILFCGKISTLTIQIEYLIEICEGEICWITIENFNDFKVGDVIEAYSD